MLNVESHWMRFERWLASLIVITLLFSASTEVPAKPVSQPQKP